MRAQLLRFARSFAVPAAAFAMAWLLKHHYSNASPEELRWILAPTTWLTSLLVRSEFAFQAGAGYLSREQSVLISPACAGVNFLVVALLSLALGFAGHFASLPRRVGWLITSIVLAYVTTLAVNALRISLSIAVAHLAVQKLGLTFQGVHRLLGIFVYLAGLLSLSLSVHVRLFSRGKGVVARSGAALPGGSDGTRVFLIALACYASVTLLVPLWGGAAHNPQYWAHAAPVSVLVGVLVALLFAVRGRSWDDGRHAFRSPEQLR